MLVLMLPISWSGLGVREGSLILLLRPYGVAPEDAVALSLLVFLRGTLGAICGGLLQARSFFLSSRNGEA